MIKIIKLFFLFLMSFSCFSQSNIFVLHSVIGDTINKQEKKDYFLFPELNDSIFNYGQIHYKNGKYYLFVFSILDSIIKEID